MKKLCISITLFFFVFCLKGQYKFTAGMGGMINNPQTDIGTVYNLSLTQFAYFGVKIPYKNVEFGLDANWNNTNWNIDYFDPNGFFVDLSIQTDHLKLSPNAELKIFKFFSLTMGGYTALRLNEVVNSNFITAFAGSSNPVSLSPITKRWDFGWSNGAKIHFSKKISIIYNSIRGLKNIARDEIDIDGVTVQNSILKNRFFQLGVEFNLSEFL